MLVAVNNAWAFWPDVHVTVNPEWWNHYYTREPDLQIMIGLGRCWHSDQKTAYRYGLNRFGWQDSDETAGLSENPDEIHLGHGSGFAALNIAHLMGCSPIALLGHDMRYPARYDPHRREPGGSRHYFGEYPQTIQHWPSVRVGAQKQLQGLIDCYRWIPDRNPDARIFNCTPGSALDVFPMTTIEEFIDGIPI